MSPQITSRREKWLITAIFILALAYSVYGVTFRWTTGFMSGHEFRQSQTAITSYYIDKENNFSLLYETPVLGKPWVSILLEVPIYEWSVVLLSRATGLPHVVAARTVSATCFYLMLPAVWLLLGSLGMAKPRRLLILALVLSAPVYVYYSRAFLMDSMAMMCCVWWLLGFVQTMQKRTWNWLLLAIVAGTGAALIKSFMLAVWMIPGAAYGAWLLGCELRARAGWSRSLKTILWGGATVVVALGSLKAWLAYTDPIKEAHASAWIFTSKNLSLGNWGLFDLKAVFSKDVWRALLHCWDQAIMWRWLIGLGLVAGLFFRAVRWRVVAMGALFFAPQLLFPFAYAYQDYYFYSCAIFLSVALGFMMLGAIDSRLPRWSVVLLMIIPFAAQITAYWQDYRKGQSILYPGGYPFTDVVRELTPTNSVIIVAGADWASMTPLYSQRRALMVRNGLEYDSAYLERAFKDLSDEDISALIVNGDVRHNEAFLNNVAAHFDMDISAPTFSTATVDVYAPRLYAKGLQLAIKNARARYPDVILPKESSAQAPAGTSTRVRIPEAAAREAFFNIRPAPYQIDFELGVSWLEIDHQKVLSAHPLTDLWLKPPAQATHIEWSFGIMPGAYAKPPDATDGVEFSVMGEMPNGQARQIYRRVLDPTGKPADRGTQHEHIPYQPLPGETLRFSTRPMANYAFDWAYIVQIKVN